MSNLSLFRKKGKPITRKRGDLLFRQGEFDASVYVVEEGLLKAYYLTSEGKELIKSFIREGEYIGSLVACTSSEACTFSLACLEDCSLLRIPFAELQAQAAKDAESAASVIQSLMDLAIKKERREYEFLCLPRPGALCLVPAALARTSGAAHTERHSTVPGDHARRAKPNPTSGQLVIPGCHTTRWWAVIPCPPWRITRLSASK